MAGFYTALIGTLPTIQWPGLSPACTIPQERIVLAGAVNVAPQQIACAVALLEQLIAVIEERHRAAAARQPAEPRAHGLQVKTCSSSCLW